ncbi:hypothetical protein CsatA_017632 [Cannabis sativa]
METIDIKQSLGMKMNILGSIDEKMNFFKMLKITDKCLIIVVHARQVEGKKFQTSARLASADIVAPISDMREFFLHYGDSYVSSITTGGEYIGVYSFHTETESDHINLEAELKAHGIFKFGTLDANFQGKLDRAVEGARTQVSFKQIMLGLNSELPKREDMVDFARRFPSQKLTAPKVLAFETTGYEHVVGVPNGFNPVALNRNILVGTGFRDLGLAGKHAKLSQMIDRIDLIQSIYSFYGGFSDPNLSNVGVQAKKDIESLEKTFSDYQSNPIPNVIIPQLPSLSKGMPEIQYSIHFSPEFGDGTGAAQPMYPYGLFTGVDAYIQSKTRITGIQMHTNNCRSNVNSIIIDFESTLGRRTESYGKAEGRLSKKLVLEDGEFIKKIYVRSGVELDKLGLYIRDDRGLLVGGHGGVEHYFPIPDGSFIVGFRGFYSTLIDQTQLIYAAFKPAKWVPFTISR